MFNNNVILPLSGTRLKIDSSLFIRPRNDVRFSVMVTISEVDILDIVLLITDFMDLPCIGPRWVFWHRVFNPYHIQVDLLPIAVIVSNTNSEVKVAVIVYVV